MSFPRVFNLFSNNLVRPVKIRWVFDCEGEVIDCIHSKSLRKFLRNSEQIAKDHQLTIQVTDCDFEMFKDWLKFYELKIAEHGYQIKASMDWFKQKQAEQKQVKIIQIEKQGVRVSAGILVINSVENSITLAFSANEYLSLGSSSNASMGYLLNYEYLKWAKQHRFKLITSGRSRNAFGVANRYGYLEYKLRMGYYPVFEESVELDEEVPLDANGMAQVFCLEIEADTQTFQDYKLKIVCISPEKSQDFPNLGILKNLPVLNIKY